MKIINRVRMVRKKSLIFKRQQFIFCLLIFFSISLVGENQRMFSQYGHMKHWGLKTALAEDMLGGGGGFPIRDFTMGAGVATMLYSLNLISSNDPLILSDLDDFLKNNQFTKDFSKEEIIGLIEGFLMSRALRDDGAIKDWDEDQKIKLMILTIVLSSTQSDDKQEIRTLLDSILRDVLYKTGGTFTLGTEKARIKTKFVETIELVALNLEKNANRNSFIKNRIVDIKRRLKLILERMIESNSQDQKIINKANQVLKTLNEPLSQPFHDGPDLKIETLFSGFNVSGMNTFIESLDEKRIIGLVEGFLIFRLLEAGGHLMNLNPNQEIKLWTEDQKTKLRILSMGLSLLISSSEKNRSILLSELASILSQIGGSIKNYKGDEKTEKESRLIIDVDALEFIAFNLVKTNEPSVIDHSSANLNLTLMLRKFAEHKNPMVRFKVLEFIEKVGPISKKTSGELNNIYEIRDLLMQLVDDRDSFIRQKAGAVIENLDLKLKSFCFGIFQKLVPNEKLNQ